MNYLRTNKTMNFVNLLNTAPNNKKWTYKKIENKNLFLNNNKKIVNRFQWNMYIIIFLHKLQLLADEKFYINNITAIFYLHNENIKKFSSKTKHKFYSPRL